MSKGYPKPDRVRDYVANIDKLLTELRQEVELLRLCALSEERELVVPPEPERKLT